MNYWDVSALLKLYVPEADSDLFTELATGAQEAMLSSAVARAQVLCTLYRKEHFGDLNVNGAARAFRKFSADCEAGRILLVPYGPDLMDECERLVKLSYDRSRPVLIRALDVIHLASAVVSKADALVATDKRLRELAGVTGMPVLPER